MEKCYCPNCTGQTKHNVIFEKLKRQDPLDDFKWYQKHQMIECCGCENIQFRIIYSDETMVKSFYHDGEGQYPDHEYFEDHKLYPPFITEHKILRNLYCLPEKIRIVYNETLEAIKSGSYILAGVGLRALIEAITLDQKIGKGNLQVRINKLVTQKLITQNEADRLHAIRFLGNDSVHEMDVPQFSKIQIALEITEHLIKNLYLINVEVQKHLDAMINNYGEFRDLVFKIVFKYSKEEEKTLEEILDKHLRRIEKSYIANYEEKLIEEIKSNVVHWLKLGEMKIKKIKGEDFEVQYYKIFPNQIDTMISSFGDISF